MSEHGPAIGCGFCDDPACEYNASVNPWDTIATLTAENAALTQRVAWLENELLVTRAWHSDSIEKHEAPLNAAIEAIKTERDTAMAEAGRLRRVVEAARAHAQALSNGDDPYDALTAMDDALAALDAPGGGA